MNWEEFNEVVRIFLLVDKDRKGKGVQEYIDRMIVASVIDLQRYVPALKKHAYDYFSPYNLVDANLGYNLINVDIPNADGYHLNSPDELPDIDVHQGKFFSGKSIIKEIVIRRVPTVENGQKVSRYFYPNRIPWEKRHTLIDGGIVERTTNIPGRISFSKSHFWTAPKLRDDEAIYIHYEGEVQYAPMYRASTEATEALVVFDDIVAKASADYVKAHLAREVDNDLNQFNSYWQMYRKQRAEIHVEEKNFTGSAVEELIEEDDTPEFIHDGTVIPAQYDTITSGLVYSAAQLKADELVAQDNFSAGLEGDTATYYALILTSGSNGTTSHNGEGDKFISGERVTITAVPSQGYKFDRWIGVGLLDPYNPVQSVVMSENRYIRGIFKALE